jgi:hypothetical protein
VAQTLNSADSGTAKPDRKGRKPKADQGPGEGHNSGITAEQKEAVYRVRMAAVRRTKADVDRALAAVKAVRKHYTTARNEFKRDTGIELQDLDFILRRAELTRGDIGKRQDDVNYMLEMEGLPVGGQSSMFAAFDKRPTLIRDQSDWEAEGRRAYNRGAERDPVNVPGEFHQAWLTGYAAEEERTIWAMAMVKPVDRDTGIGGSRPDIDPEPEGDNDGDIDHAEVDAQARKLRKSGFLDATAPEGADDQAAA